MKKISVLISILFLAVSSFGQGRGTYGTLQNYAYTSGTIYNNGFTSVTADTLKGVDTTYIYFPFSSAYKLCFDLKTVNVADSLSGTAVLQARTNQTSWLEIAGQWQSITGETTTCTTCVGASKTYSTVTGTNHVVWNVGQTPFQNFRIRIVGNRSTDTTAVTAKAYYSY